MTKFWFPLKMGLYGSVTAFEKIIVTAAGIMKYNFSD